MVKFCKYGVCLCVYVCVRARVCSLNKIFKQIFDVKIFVKIFCDIHIIKTFVCLSV